MENEFIDAGLGHSLPPKKNNFKDSLSQEVTDQYIEEAVASLATCTTKREILEQELNDLSICVAVATKVYKQKPVPDHAYQLAALANTHKSVLSQLEKMQDPKTLLGESEEIIKAMFMKLVKALADEINKTKMEFAQQYPKDKVTVEDNFSRMLNAIQPDTQKLFENLNNELKDVFGIKTIASSI